MRATTFDTVCLLNPLYIISKDWSTSCFIGCLKLSHWSIS